MTQVPLKAVYSSCISRSLRYINPLISIPNSSYGTKPPNMPVPMPATTDKSTSATSSSATAQTAHDVEKPSTQAVASTTHTEKTEKEREAERLYEERIEEEYAKREGGA